MTSRNLLALCLLLGVGSLCAQTMPADGQPPNPSQSQTLSDEQQIEPSAARAEESGAPVPLPLNIDATSLRFSPELARSNYLQMGVQTGANYDDNLLNDATQQIGGFSYNVMPNIRLDVSRKRLIWSLSYAGGYSINERFSAYNQGSHDAGIDLRYRLSPHVNVRLHDNFVRTFGFLNQSQGDIAGAGVGVIQQPNTVTITPLAQRQDNLGTAEITYQYSAGDMIGASGTLYNSHFSNVVGTSGLIDTASQEADGFYNHRFSPRNWSGVVYKFQRLRFNPATEDLDTHSFLLVHTIYLQPRMALAFFAGPEYSQLSSQIVATSITLPFVSVVSSSTSRQIWTVSGGISFSWQGEHTSIGASAARKVTNGGGLLSGVQIMAVSGAVRRQVGRLSAVRFGAAYGDDRTLEQNASTFNLLKSATGSVAWEQHFGRSVTVSLGYSREFQQQSALGASAGNVNRNRGWVTLGYNFTRPLGR